MTSLSPAPSIVVAWRLRDEPLLPTCVVARGAAARVLARRVLQRDDASLAKLEGLSAGEWLLFRGAASDLPWADGAIYLGRDAAAPALLLPTLWHSAPDAALLQRALQTRFHNRAPLAIVPPGAHRNAVKNLADASAESLSKKTEHIVIASGAKLRAPLRNLDVDAQNNDTTPREPNSVSPGKCATKCHQRSRFRAVF